MRSSWNGTLAWGRIGIPIGLGSVHAEEKGGFRTLHRPCLQPLGLGRVCPEHGLVDNEDELVKGVEVAPGQFVLIEDEELAAIAPESDRQIVVQSFLEASQLSPLALNKAYYLIPGKHQASRRPYALLHATLVETGLVAVARFVAWKSEHVAVVQAAADGVLVLRTIHQAELHPATDVAKAIADAVVDREELELAVELARRLEKKIGRTDLQSRHKARLAELVEAKVAGEQVAQPERAEGPKATPTLDLASALQASLKDAPRRRKPRVAKTQQPVHA